MLFFLAEAQQFDIARFLEVTGTPGTILLLYIVWWKTIGREQSADQKATAEAHRRSAAVIAEVTQNLYRYCDRTEKQQDKGESMLSHGERLVERIDRKFPSGVMVDPKVHAQGA